MPLRHAIGLIALAVAPNIFLVGLPDATGTTPPPIPSARQVLPVPAVGPLFLAGLGQPHTCSASVVHSRSRDLVLTAAHCISGTGAGIQFVPGYDRGRMQHGVWTAVQVYVDPAWKSWRDPRHDVAILKMRRQVRVRRWVGVEDLVGGNVLGVAPPDGTRMRVPAYPAGINDSPINCGTSIYRTAGYLSFECRFYYGGTSGAPFVRSVGVDHHQVVFGVIGGLHQGGCLESTSYSSPFGSDTSRILARATLGVHPDILPSPDGANC